MNQPWLNEPLLFETTMNGLPVKAIRRNQRGHWCGYVWVPPGHPLHGKHYMNGQMPDVHGGVTFTDSIDGVGDWWIGFDCNHGFDYSPQYNPGLCQSPEDYKTLEFVKEQLDLLSKQVDQQVQEPGMNREN